MTDELKVEVPVKCDRTGKVRNISMTLSEAADHAKARRQAETSAEEVVTILKGLPQPMPDLAVMFRGTAVALPYVDPKKDAAVLKLLHELTQSSLFPKPASKPRAKSSAKTGKSTSLEDSGLEVDMSEESDDSDDSDDSDE